MRVVEESPFAKPFTKTSTCWFCKTKVEYNQDDVHWRYSGGAGMYGDEDAYYGEIICPQCFTRSTHNCTQAEAAYRYKASLDKQRDDIVG